jgi:hypothetical protein
MKKGVALVFGFVLVVVFAFSLGGVNAIFDCSIQGSIYDMQKCASDTNGRSCSDCISQELICGPSYLPASSCSYIGISPSGWDVKYIKTSSFCTYNWTCPSIDSTPYCSSGLGYKSIYSCKIADSCITQTVRESTFDSNCFFIISANWTRQGSTINLANITSMVNLTVYGVGILNREVNFSIYDMTNTLIYNKNISAQNNDYAYLNWTTQTEGSYYFNVTLVSIGKTLKSSNIQFSKNVQTRSVACNGTLPANASWVDGVGNFTQSKDNLVDWRPLEVNATFNFLEYSYGECLFNCSSGFSWNGSACLVNITIPLIELPGEDYNYCAQILNQDDCESVRENGLIANNSVSSSSICGKTVSANINGQNCYNETNCGCVWKNGNCSGGFTSDYFCEGNPTPTPYGECYWTTSVVDKCDSSEAAVILTGTALWNSLVGNAPRDSDCMDYTRSLPCVSKAELPAFSLFNIVFAFLGIVVVYFLFGRKFR